jgi:endonuclease/exonuclease/phosphatase family metal-dependent hydrolase
MNTNHWFLPLLLTLALLAGAVACGHSSNGNSTTEVDDDASPPAGLDDDQAPDDDDDASPGGPLALSAMSFNIAFSFPKSDLDAWDVRAPWEGETINYHHCDLVGLQEPLWWQVADLHHYSPGYDDWHIWDPDATEFYLDGQFDLLDKGMFWLSPTPDWLFDGWGNVMPRLVVWTKLRDHASGREFFWANTHYDSTSPFQEKASPFLLTQVEELAGGLPIVVTGDFNSTPSDTAYRILTQGAEPGGFHLTDSYAIAAQRDVRQSDGDTRTWDPAQDIDHIFVANGAWTCSYWVVDMTQYGDPPRDPSDHFAIAANIELGSD